MFEYVRKHYRTYMVTLPKQPLATSVTAATRGDTRRSSPGGPGSAGASVKLGEGCRHLRLPRLPGQTANPELALGPVSHVHSASSVNARVGSGPRTRLEHRV